jgi:hypothetical protein
MSASGAPSGHCRVVAGEHLLGGAGGAAAVCLEIERAIAAAAPRAKYSVLVKAMPHARLSAALTVNGHALPEQNFAVMDGELDSASVHRFGQSLAAQVAKAAK